ncbi:MAG: septum formation initiator family protein [Chloroflexota bacterium]|nr:septum formation initiator family protein [Chloroflexota bacterium]MDE2897034.1 septum formation initiator family protein [Chloroflexota bacterium]
MQAPATSQTNDRARLLGQVLALVGVLVLVAVVVRETTNSPAYVAANERIEELNTQIDRVERSNAELRERLAYAESLPALREVAKRDLGLVDPGDRAIIIMDDLSGGPLPTPVALEPPPPPPPPPLRFGHVGAWLETFAGG